MVCSGLALAAAMPFWVWWMRVVISTTLLFFFFFFFLVLQTQAVVAQSSTSMCRRCTATRGAIPSVAVSMVMILLTQISWSTS